MNLDREFLYELENCKLKSEIEKLIEEFDDDDTIIVLENQYEQILRINKNENIENIKKILIYRYRQYCKEN